MTRKTLGHIELIWRCPRCGTTNPGPQRTCLGCGAAQPTDVKFEQPLGAELIQDEEKGKEATAGPDIHCPFCGTRNPAGSEVCLQCGGDLVEGEKRDAGQVLGAYSAAPPPQIHCPSCGTLNPNNARVCSQCNSPLNPETVQPTPPAPPAPRQGLSWALILGLLAIVVLCGVVIAMFARGAQRNELVGVVDRVMWERAIPIEALVQVEYTGWRDEIPADAVIGTCKDAFRYESSAPEPNSEEVCGTPYTEDQGSGYAEVVQDCVYRVYAESCTYQVSEWRVVDTLTASGADITPLWPTVSLAEGQRQSQNWQETYTVWFDVEGKSYPYRINEVEVFQGFLPGSQWKLIVSGFGNVVGVEP